MIEFLTAPQARGARAMLDWSVQKLAEKSKISTSSIQRIETGFGVPANVTLDMLVKLRGYFESKGFTFTLNDTIGPGVSWKRHRGRAERRSEQSAGELNLWRFHWQIAQEMQETW